MKFELKTIRIASFTRRNVRLCIVNPFSSPKDESEDLSYIPYFDTVRIIETGVFNIFV